MNLIIYILIYAIPISLLCLLLEKPRKKDEFLITGFTCEGYAIGRNKKDQPVVNKNIKCSGNILKDLYGYPPIIEWKSELGK